MDTGTPPPPGGPVEAGAYDVLRRRLGTQAAELTRRAEALNSRRTEEFGSTGLRLLGSERIRTEQPSTPATSSRSAAGCCSASNAAPAGATSPPSTTYSRCTTPS